MPLGQRLPAPTSDWRVVEGDLHDIARRMREYDPDARLIRQDQTGHLGIAVEQRRGIRRRLMFAKSMYDLRTDRPLTGVPDARALACQRAYDGRRFTTRQNWLDWHRAMNLSDVRREAREDGAASDQNGDIAEQFAHTFKKESPHRPRAFIGQGLPRKEAA